MLSNLTFGKYVNKKSLVHKLDARAKIFIYVILVSLIFINIGIIGYIILLALLFLLIPLSRVPLFIYWRATLPILIMSIFITILNIFISREGSVLFTIGNYDFYRGSFERSLEIFFRIFLMVNFTTMLTATTKQIDIAVSISSLLRPFKVIKLPVNEIGMMISITLRFIPTLIDEALIIVSAQASRGVDFKKGKLKEKAKALVSLIVPLFVSSLSKAEELSNAMEARGYDPKAKRSKFRVLKLKWGDTLTIIFFLALIIFYICVTQVSELQPVRYLDTFFERW